jgi:hypothetical protein
MPNRFVRHPERLRVRIFINNQSVVGTPAACQTGRDQRIQSSARHHVLAGAISSAKTSAETCKRSVCPTSIRPPLSTKRILSPSLPRSGGKAASSASPSATQTGSTLEARGGSHPAQPAPTARTASTNGSALPSSMGISGPSTSTKAASTPQPYKAASRCSQVLTTHALIFQRRSPVKLHSVLHQRWNPNPPHSELNTTAVRMNLHPAPLSAVNPHALKPKRFGQRAGAITHCLGPLHTSVFPPKPSTGLPKTSRGPKAPAVFSQPHVCASGPNAP